MGLTEDQKMELAIAYIKKCNDFNLLMFVANVTHRRINELLEAYNEDIQKQ